MIARPHRPKPFYEYREYRLTLGATPPTLARWEEVLASRMKISPIVGAMYEVGTPQNYVQFWPYRSLEQRAQVRTQAIERGIWPPRDVMPMIQRRKSAILMPTAFSPLQ